MVWDVVGWVGFVVGVYGIGYCYGKVIWGGVEGCGDGGVGG